MVKKRNNSSGPLFLGNEIFDYLEKIGGCREKSQISELWQHWISVVGVELGSQVASIEEKERILILRVEDSLLMQEVGSQKEEILEKVNTFLGSDYFTKVRVSI